MSVEATGFTPTRLIGLLFLASLMVACAVGGLKRTRVELRPASRKLLVNGQSIGLPSDAHLELDQTDPSRSDATLHPYEVRVVDRSGLSQILLRSTLSRVLNDLSRVQVSWPVAVALGLNTSEVLGKVVQQQAQTNARWIPVRGQISLPLRDRQSRIVVTLLGVSCVAASVLAFLATGQLERAGKIGNLSLVLGSLLILMPASIALHVGLGKIDVTGDETNLVLERRRGLLGTKTTVLPTRSIEGSWLVPNRYGADALFLCGGTFYSVPVARSATALCSSAFGQQEQTTAIGTNNQDSATKLATAYQRRD
jgi:hypothetical protein